MKGSAKMKYILIIFFSILTVGLVHAEKDKIQQTPSKFMAAWVDEYNKNDAKAIVEYYDESEETDCLVSFGMWFKGFKNIEKMYHRDMKACQFYDSKAEEMKHRMLGDVAVVSFVHKFKYMIHESGAHYRVHIRTTATLRKDKESWKIVSEHSSPIKGIQRAILIPEAVQNPM